MPDVVSLFPELDEVVSDGGDVANSMGVYMERQRCGLAPMSAFGGKADSLAHLSECPLIARSGHWRWPHAFGTPYCADVDLGK